MFYKHHSSFLLLQAFIEKNILDKGSVYKVFQSKYSPKTYMTVLSCHIIEIDFDLFLHVTCISISI